MANFGWVLSECSAFKIAALSSLATYEQNRIIKYSRSKQLKTNNGNHSTVIQQWEL